MGEMVVRIKPSQARKAAFKILLKFENREIKFLKESLNRYIENSKMKKTDIALATDIVYGVMRWRGFLDSKISIFSKKNINSIDQEVLIILRIAIYQILFLNKIPQRAAVDEAARLAYFCKKKSAVAFINGILREFIRRGAEGEQGASGKGYGSRITDDESRATSHESLSNHYSHPEWMFKRWVARFGIEGAEKLCRFNNEIPPNAIRVNTIKISPDKLLSLFRKEKIDCELSRYCDEGLIVSSLQDISKNPLFKKGYFYIQDEASMLVAKILQPKSGENILDLCSAPGGKATYIAQIMNNKGLIIAMDINFKRLLMVKENSHRMGISVIKTICGDARDSYAVLKIKFDKVLVDSPCSGTGILRRNPEIKWLRSYRDIVGLGKLQIDLLTNASLCVKPDGILVYSTCSSEPEENQEVIESFLANHKNFVLEKIGDEIPKEAKGFITEDGYFHSLPILTENSSMDIFFVAKMRKIF